MYYRIMYFFEYRNNITVLKPYYQNILLIITKYEQLKYMFLDHLHDALFNIDNI